ncbi:MAG: flavin reductase [Nitrospirae bacterium]|nr:flavin reductase [Nitrospirota bacterium]
MSEFRKVNPQTIADNVFKLVGTDWMLITAGKIDGFNTMTGSWGGMGVLWDMNVCFCVIRPTRYTYSFMEQSDYFSLSFFNVEFRNVLTFCGTNSGRDVDKPVKTGLTPIGGASGCVYFDEARLVMECRKIYYQDITPINFADPLIDSKYPLKDYHRMYIGEVVNCLVK